MEYSPPPLFKQGPSALARLIFFVLLAFVLLISDARFRTLEIVRGMLGAGLYPLQRAALVPRDIFMGAADLAVTSATLRGQNDELRKKNLQLSLQANTASALSAENEHLRSLLQLSQRMTTQSIPTEIQYDTRDPFTQKVIIGRGSQQGIQNGSPVVNEDGVIGHGHARVSAAGGGHAPHRQGPGRAGASRAHGSAQRDLRHTEGRYARSALCADQRGSADRRRTGDERPRRHLSAGAAGRQGRTGRQAGRHRLCPRGVPAGCTGARCAPVAGASLCEHGAAASG